MAKIELRGLGHFYNTVDGKPNYALHPLDLTWEDGGTYALLGPSGCGKSTMLNIISGLLTPSEGRVLINGVDMTSVGAVKRNIAQVFQFPVVYPSKTVFENLAFPLRCRNKPKAEIDRRVNEVANLLNLDEVLRKPARKLTPDLKQLISLGRGLVRDDVAVILMDEPLTVIDPQLKFSLRRKLRDISAQHGHTLVYVTHDQNEAMTLAEQVVVMDHGRVVQMGSPQVLFEEPVHRHVGYFIGSPSMNFLDGTVQAGTVSILGREVGTLRSAEGRSLSEVVVGIRPELVTLADTPQAGTLPATVTDVQDMGCYAIVSVDLGNGTIVKLRTPDRVPAVGAPTHLVFERDKVRFYRDNWLVA
ncbi:ABC transporter ATP-binding protein [Ciceribacter ferrooxidans]|uniref:ABC transporter ATP-binding protein n=1 Tax=Ciceribacter ferrooxidans TaxID=2509717 RepID=A0A4Q2SXP9_9HYPH|nr:ABC transporter ATP-binding protein [Ciceribacter ferrooxidans]RYC10935.1 ABC transporter ATP-binding protein [Ciceribacter ferrooxidans]